MTSVKIEMKVILYNYRVKKNDAVDAPDVPENVGTQSTYHAQSLAENS